MFVTFEKAELVGEWEDVSNAFIERKVSAQAKNIKHEQLASQQFGFEF